MTTKTINSDSGFRITDPKCRVQRTELVRRVRGTREFWNLPEYHHSIVADAKARRAEECQGIVLGSDVLGRCLVVKKSTRESVRLWIKRWMKDIEDKFTLCIEDRNGKPELVLYRTF